MNIDDFAALEAEARATRPPAVAPLRLVTLLPPAATPQRRRMPRRQIVAGCPFERRRADRRQRRPGIDGLLRMVLSDSWY